MLLILVSSHLSSFLLMSVDATISSTCTKSRIFAKISPKKLDQSIITGNYLSFFIVFMSEDLVAINIIAMKTKGII
jgi:hypothetical protein